MDHNFVRQASLASAAVHVLKCVVFKSPFFWMDFLKYYSLHPRLSGLSFYPCQPPFYTLFYIFKYETSDKMASATERDLAPLIGASPTEVVLTKAPLVRVLAQVMFDPILILQNEATIAPFQNSIRAVYPKISRDFASIVSPFINFDPQSRSDFAWRFHSADSAWRISLATTFLAIETTNYVSRADLLERIQNLVTNLKIVVNELHVSRVGVRYVSQVKMPELSNINIMIKPEMLGIYSSMLREKVQHAVTETLCDTAEGSIIARWGMLPAHGTHDPTVMMPIPEPSWFLDIDAFAISDEPKTNMSADQVRQMAEKLAMRSYSFFRWVVTDKFLSTYGGR